jgi:hypothetical protein
VTSAAIAPLLALVCLSPGQDEASRPGAVRVYTNEDLARVSPRRGETGVLSAAPAPHTPTAAPAPGPAPARGEAYWRREAERLEDRLEPLRDRARELRLRIEERRRQPGVRPYSDAQVEALQERLRALEERIRGLQSAFEERARRQGALPGWLR